MALNHIQSHPINNNKFPYLNETISVIQKIIQKFPVKKITMGTGFGAPGVVEIATVSFAAVCAAFLSAGVCPENCLVGENSPNL